MIRKMLLVLIVVASLGCPASQGGEPGTKDEVRYLLWSHPRGNCYCVAPADEQAARKIAQGIPSAIAVQTRGATHAAGAVRWQGRIFLVDEESVHRWLRRGAVRL